MLVELPDGRFLNALRVATISKPHKDTTKVSEPFLVDIILDSGMTLQVQFDSGNEEEAKKAIAKLIQQIDDALSASDEA